MDPTTALLICLLGSISSLAGVFLGAYASEQRERLARKAAFRNEQLKSLYGPLITRITQMQQRWTVVNNVYASKEEIIRQHNLKEARHGQEYLAQITPAQDLHQESLQKDKETWEEVYAIMSNNMHLAEPETQRQFAAVCLYVERLRAIRHGTAEKRGIPFDHTGENPRLLGELGAIRDYFTHIQEQYDEIASQLRTANYSEVYEPAAITVQLPPTRAITDQDQQN